MGVRIGSVESSGVVAGEGRKSKALLASSLPKQESQEAKTIRCYFAAPHSTEHLCTQCHVDRAHENHLAHMAQVETLGCSQVGRQALARQRLWWRWPWLCTPMVWGLRRLGRHGTLDYCRSAKQTIIYLLLVFLNIRIAKKEFLKRNVLPFLL